MLLEYAISVLKGISVRGQMSLLLSMLIIAVGLPTYYQPTSAALLDNIGMDLATKELLHGQSMPNTEENLILLKNALSAKQTNVFQSRTRKMVIGSLFWRANQKDLALKYWHEARIEPEFFIAKIGSASQQSNLDYIDRAISLAPDRSELLYYKGFLLEEDAHLIVAKKWYDLAEKYNNWVNLSLGFDVLYQRGQLLYKNQQLEEAEKVLAIAINFSEKTAVDDTRKVAAAHRTLGIMAQQSGRIANAKTHFLKAVELYPEDYWNYLSLGLIAETEKESEDTIFEYFDYAHVVAPQNLLAYTYPASHYLGRNQLDKWRYFCKETPGYLQHQQPWIDVCQTPGE